VGRTVSGMRILLVGDTHGNTRWWANFVTPAASALEVDLVFQLGDFGYWPRGEDFLRAVTATDVPVVFLDGNHEHHPALQQVVQGRRTPVQIADNVSYAPRGCHLTWDGVEVAVLGGAHSIDRALRTPGRDWFVEEGVNNDDLAHVAKTGAAQVLLSHDAPSCAPVPLSPRAELPPAWYRELEACDEHRQRMQEALDVVQPRVVVHGHYHVSYAADVVRPWGSVHFAGLSQDGTGVGNLAVLECIAGRVSLHRVAETSVA